MRALLLAHLRRQRILNSLTEGKTDMNNKTITHFFGSFIISVAALIDSINPCAFSVLIVTIAFLLSIGQPRTSLLAIGGAYILGIFLVYVVIGRGLLQTLHIFDTPHFMAKVGAAMLIASSRSLAWIKK